MYHTAPGLAPFAANGCAGFPSPGRGCGGLLRAFGAQQNLLQTLVNRFRQSRHGCLFQQKCRARQY